MVHILSFTCTQRNTEIKIALSGGLQSFIINNLYNMINWRKVISFDIDDTIIIPSVANPTWENIGNPENIALYKKHQSEGHYMILWSGSGQEWAKMWWENLWLNPDEIREKVKSEDVDICYDDCIVDLAKENIRVKRVNNKVSRKEWNNTKRFAKIER